jgi:hypothetical protein
MPRCDFSLKKCNLIETSSLANLRINQVLTTCVKSGRRVMSVHIGPHEALDLYDAPCGIVSGFALRFAGSVHTPTRACRYFSHLDGCDRCRNWNRIASAPAENPRTRSLQGDSSSESLPRRSLWGIQLAMPAETLTSHGQSASYQRASLRVET